MSGAGSPVIKLAAVLAAALAVSGAAVWSNPQLVERVRLAVSRAAEWGNRQMATSRSPGPVSVTGTIEATQVDVSVKITGRILERLVKEGDRVTRGQVLVRLDDSELAADVRRLDSIHSRASTLARFELARSWRDSESFVGLIRQVTAGDLQRVARAYFQIDRRTVGVLLPGAAK